MFSKHNVLMMSSWQHVLKILPGLVPKKHLKIRCIKGFKGVKEATKGRREVPGGGTKLFLNGGF